MKQESVQDEPEDIDEIDLITPSQTLGSRNNSIDDISRAKTSNMILSCERRLKYMGSNWSRLGVTPSVSAKPLFNDRVEQPAEVSDEDSSS